MSNMKSTKIIVVDLDGTLTFSDTLYESIIALFRNKPFLIFNLPLWLAKGIAYLKLKVAENCVLNVESLPYNLRLINWLKEQKANGKKIILCTGANVQIAKAIAANLNLFSDVIASDENTNLTNVNKRDVLQERFGVRGYDYVGNSKADLEVWSSALHGIVVNDSISFQHKVMQVTSVSRTFSSESVSILDWGKAIRLHQWLKNLLLFVPLLATHHLINIQSFVTLMIAFVSFSLCASSIYIINDLLDLESDRSHPLKRYRPFASAKLPILMGLMIAPLLIFSSILLGMIVGKNFLAILLLYFILAAAYSIAIKRIVLVDCLTLATLYTIRIIAGAIALSLSLSFWLLSFSVFIFFSLALVKRYAELMTQLKASKSGADGRGYTIQDKPLLQIFGVSSGYISTLVIALYMRSEEVMTLYRHPKVIWFVLPALLFWISWMWYKASIGKMQEDPIIFAINDKASVLVALFIAILYVFASIGIGI